MKQISIVIPFYNEEESLPLFFAELSRVMNQMQEYRFELLFVDDGSKDHTLDVLKKLAQKSPSVQFLSFFRNFGKGSAIYAGLKHSNGDYVAVMDADLQDLPDMISALENEGYDSAAARRTTRRGEPPIRSFFARLFYRVINWMADVQIMDGARDYRMMSRAMKNAVLELKEYNRFSKGIFGWVGFRTKWLPYENRSRVAGNTKWSFWKLLTYSIEGIIAFSTIPLSVATFSGLLFFLLSLCMITFIIIKTLLFGDPVGGWPSLACIILFVGGVQLFCTGIIGKYLSKIYLETKQRPNYIICETSRKNTEKYEI